MPHGKKSNVCWAPVEKAAAVKKNTPVSKTAKHDGKTKVMRRSSVPFLSMQKARGFAKHYEEEYRRLRVELGLNKRKKNRKNRNKKKKPQGKTDLSYDNSVTMMIGQRLGLIESHLEQYSSEIAAEQKIMDGELDDRQGQFLEGVQSLQKHQRRADHEYDESRRKKLLHLTRQTKEFLGSPGPEDYRMHAQKRPVRRHSTSGSKSHTGSRCRATWLDVVVKRGEAIPGPALYSDGVNKSSVRTKEGLRFSKALRIQKDKARSPGPCEYSPSISTLKTSGVSQFPADSTRHFDMIQQRAATIPGPADYGPEEDIDIKKTKLASPEWGLTQAYKSMRRIYSRSRAK